MFTLNRLLRNANIERQKHWPGADAIDVPFRALELVNEVGELCGAVKKDARRLRGIAGSQAHRDHIAQEIGDTIICWDLLMESIGIGPEEAIDPTYTLSSSFEEMGGVSQALFVMDAASRLALECHVPVLSEITERPHTRKAITTMSSLMLRRTEALADTYDLDIFDCVISKFNMTSARNTIDVYIDKDRRVITNRVQWGTVY